MDQKVILKMYQQELERVQKTPNSRMNGKIVSAVFDSCAEEIRALGDTALPRHLIFGFIMEKCRLPETLTFRQFVTWCENNGL